MSRAFSCANRPLFMRLLVENSALELVFFFSTDTLNFFLVYLSIAERRVQKQKGNAENERQRVAKSGREGERERGKMHHRVQMNLELMTSALCQLQYVHTL